MADVCIGCRGGVGSLAVTIGIGVVSQEPKCFFDYHGCFKTRANCPKCSVSEDLRQINARHHEED